MRAVPFDGRLTSRSFYKEDPIGVWLHQAKLDEAIPLLQRAMEIRPHDAQVQVEIGKTHIAAGRCAEAAAELESAARENPGFIAVHEALAEVYERLKRPADREVQRAIAQRLEGQDQSSPAIQKLHKQIMERLKAEASG
jgi:predicted Zn-dependent protease